MNRIIALVLALAMLMSMTTIFSVSAEEPITIHAVTGKHAGGIPDTLEGDFAHMDVLEKLGINLIVEDLQDFENTLGARISADEIPDLMYLSPEMLQTYASKGYLRPISDIKGTEVWDHIMATYGQYSDIDIVSNYYDGEMYGFPAAMALGDYYYEIYVRQDWVEKYGLKIPTTVDELYDYCMDCAKNDYDGNGVIDTVGFTCWGVLGMAAITSPYDTAMGNYLLIRDGKVTNTVLQPRTVEALTMVKKFFDAGLVDGGWTSNSESKATTFSCNVGVVAMPWSNMDKASYTKQYKEVVPEAQYYPIEAMDAGEGPRYSIVAHDVNVGSKMCVGANVTDEQYEAILKIIDWMCTPEGEMMCYMGVEGRHWNYVDGVPQIDQEYAAEVNYIHEYQWLGRNDSLYLAAKFPEAAHSVEWGLRYNPLETFNSSVIVPDDFDLADMEDYIKSQMIAFVKGERDLAEYEKFVQELYDSYDFGTYMEFATEQLVELGLANE